MELIFKVWLIVALIFVSYMTGYKAGSEHGKRMFVSDAYGNITRLEKR